MKISPRLLLLFPVLALGACATTSQPPRAAAASTPPTLVARAPAAAVPAPVDPQPAARPDQPPPASNLPRPDAVIEIEPGSAALTPEMRARLDEIVRQLKEDDRSQLRLEGYVPNGGSPTWNLGVADKSLRLVREYLESLRVPSYRVQLAAFGGKPERARDNRRNWVEIYLLRGRR